MTTHPPPGTERLQFGPPGNPGPHEAQAGRARAARAARLGVWVLVAVVAAFIGWAAFAPLDEGVPTQGAVALATKRKTVQHLGGGIVRSVHVREGDQVAAGQLLIQLDDGVARANHDAAREHYLGLRAAEGRLLAEQAQAPRPRFHPDLLAAAGDPQVARQMAAQELLFTARRSALEAELQAIEEHIAARRASLAAYRSMRESRRMQLELLQEELRNTRGLVADGYVPRNRQLELERTVADMQAAAADIEGNIAQAERAIAEQAQRAVQRRSEYRQETAAQLADTLRAVNADGQKFKVASEELARTEIRAPAAGQVVGLQVQTVGAVIQPAQDLMDIVPEGDELLLEARVPPHLIDRIQAGQPVDARFDAFAHAPQLVVAGKVLTVSRDLLTDPQTRTSYYLARVALTPEGRKTLGDRALEAGMPVQVIFRTGERSLLTYLLRPLVQRMAASMTEH